MNCALKTIQRVAHRGCESAALAMMVTALIACSEKEPAENAAPVTEAKTPEVAASKTTPAPSPTNVVDDTPTYVEASSDPLVLVQAKNELANIRRRIVENRGLTRPIVAQLAELHSRFPNDEQVSELLVRGYTQFQEWSKLADVLLETPSANRTAAHQIQLGAALIHAERFDDAFKTLDPLITAKTDNLQLISLAAEAAYESNRSDRAAELLDANWSQLMAMGGIKAEFERAMIYLEKDQSDKAAPLLESVVKKTPMHTAALDELGGILVARGETARGNEYISQARKLRAEYTKPERVELYLLDVGQQMTAAWIAKDYGRCEDFITEFLPYATASERVILYEFQAQVLAAQGKHDLASLALAKSEAAAKEVRQGTPGPGDPTLPGP